MFKKISEIYNKEGLTGLYKKIRSKIIAPLREKIDKFFVKIFSRIYIKGFHRWFYYTFMTGRDIGVSWFGIPVSKLPLDMWIYQELFWKIKPDYIIETGTDRGGSALFFAHICDLIDNGEVITIDINNYSEKVNHPRITKIIGDSISIEVIEKIKHIVSEKNNIVILDSNHTKEHVLKEMEIYKDFVAVGNYMIVEDTNINGHPVMPGWGDGPMEAIKEFLKNRHDFVIDKSLEKFKITFYPNGFLKRIR